MLSTYLRFLSVAVLLLISQLSWAQTCNGSLGDPVISETFGAGAGTGNGTALPGGTTTYKFANQSCPADGEYNISAGFQSCFGGTWHNVPHDHTGDPDGFMMVVNASFSAGEFYAKRASGDKLCPNTTYEFSAWVANMIRDYAGTSGFILPNITFSIETPEGLVLGRESFTIPQLAEFKFEKHAIYFTTTPTGGDVIIRMINNAPGGIGNDLVLDDINFRPCGPLIEAGFGSVTETADRQLCEGESGNFTLKAEATGSNNLRRYQWQVNKNDGAGWTDTFGATGKELQVQLLNAAAGKYQYRMGVYEAANTSLSCRVYSEPLSIIVNPLPVIAIKAQTVVCEGEALKLFASGGDTYHWTGPNGFESDEQEVLLLSHADNSKDGVYTVTVTKKGCTSQASTTVSVLPAVTATVSGPVTICAGESTQLVAGGGVSYKWTPAIGLDHDNVANPIARPPKTTLYHVRVDNGTCVDESQEILVTVQALPFADAGPDIAIQEGESIKLNGTVGGNDVKYYWTPTTALSNADGTASPTASPIENTTYTLHVESLGNCGIATDEVFVRVYRKLTIPTAFSPNADGVNDFWNIDKLDTYPDCVLTVYTRDGRELYRSTGYSKPWNGLYRGSVLPAGTYYYVLDLKNGTKIRSGWVLLVR